MILLNYLEQGYSVQKLKGFAGNKNITAASIAFKIPFLLYLINSSKKQWFIFFRGFSCFVEL